MSQQLFIFLAHKCYDNAGYVLVREVVFSSFDEKAPSIYSRYYHSDLKQLKSGWVLVSLTKANLASRRFFRSAVPVTLEESRKIHDLWKESLTFKLRSNGEIVRVGAASEGESQSEAQAVQKPDEVRINSNFFFVDNPTNESFFYADKIRRSNPEMPVKILMVGPSGFGKTTIPEKYAQSAGLDFFRMNCPTIRDPEEWFGQRIAKEGSTMFVKSLFAKKLEEGNVVIVLDELNRLEPWLTNTIYPLLDDGRNTTVYDGEEIKVGNNVVFVATMNLGHNYSGVFQLDAALSNRFSFICEVGPLPTEREIDVLKNRTGVDQTAASTIVNLATSIRNLSVVECSTRTTLMIASQVSAGMSIRSSFQNAVVLRCSNQNARRQIIDVVNSAVGIYTPKSKFFL